MGYIPYQMPPPPLPENYKEVGRGGKVQEEGVQNNLIKIF